MIKLHIVTNYLDEFFQVADYGGLDISFQTRMHLFPPQILEHMSPAFRRCFNGLMLENSQEIRCLAAACFLSERVVEEIRKTGLSDALLVCHHMLDIDAGTPGTWNAKGFSALSQMSFQYLQERRISVYALHLPMDANASHINTHLSLCRVMDLHPRKPLLLLRGIDMGYIAQASDRWSSLVHSAFPQRLVFNDLPESPPEYVAVLAGMVSTTGMLEKIVSSGASCLVCGDVLLRQKTQRTEEISQWLARSNFPILCYSHKATEEHALQELLQELVQAFPTLSARFLKGEKRWK